MEFEFDKEMDSLLRQTAKGENLFAIENTPTEHIDADEISMFAENALPEKAKPRVMKHLADCDRCRTVLSNVIVLNSEAESEIAVAPATETKAETVVTSSELSWYQKLFATKNLAFGMGALALIFAVGIGFIVIQNFSSNSSEMAKAPSNSNTTLADSTSKDEMAKASNQTPFEDNDKDTIGDDLEAKKDSNSKVADSKPSVNAPSNETPNNVGERNEPTRDNDKKDSDIIASKTSPGDLGRTDSKLTDPKEPSPVADTTIAEESDDANLKNKEKEKPESRTQGDAVAQKPRKAPPKPITRRGANRARKSDIKKKPKRREEKSLSALFSEKKQVGKKTFSRRQGVWYDSAYKSQKTTNIKRGTTQYDKLEPGLRSIGNQLKGTVVVVWKSRAYKIQ